MTDRELSTAKKKFGENAKKIREQKGLSLRDVSYNCSIENSKISEIEHGKHNVTLGTILELAKGLDIEPTKLLDF